MGKGSSRRPENYKLFEAGYDSIFRRDKARDILGDTEDGCRVQKCGVPVQGQRSVQGDDRGAVQETQ